MKKILMSLAAAAALTLTGAPAAFAHHSANAQFDTSKEMRLTGVLTEMKDINPHSRWLAVIKNANGQPENWEFESVSPSALRRAGLKVKEEIVPGATLTFIYAPSWDGSRTGLITSMVVNGKTYVYAKV